MNRPRCLVLVAGLVLPALAACAPPRGTQQALSPLQQWRHWQAANTVEVHTAIAWPTGDGGTFRAAGFVYPGGGSPWRVYLDDAELAGYDARWPGEGQWIVDHEHAHAWLYGHDGMNELYPGADWLIRNEQGAQCIAEVVEGHGDPMPDPEVIEPGAWRCPPEYVALTRWAMGWA